MAEHPPVFDALAAQYDDDFTRSFIGQAQRSEVWYHLQPFLPADPCDILELNCGTGHDARMLAALGHRVLATDISPAMIARAGQAPSPVQWKVMDARNLFSCEQKFDLVFSNFGGLNFLSGPELETLAVDLSACLKPGGRLVLVFIHNYCLWETIYFMLRFRYGKAFRRQYGAADFRGEKIYYYSQRQIQQIFSAYQLQAAYPIGILTPPSYEEKFVRLIRRTPRLQKTPRRLERTLATIMGADHRMYIFKSRYSP